MTDVTLKSVSTSANEQPNTADKTSLPEGESWTPEKGEALFIEFDTPKKIDRVETDGLNSDKPIKIRVGVWSEKPTNNEPAKEVSLFTIPSDEILCQESVLQIYSISLRKPSQIILYHKRTTRLYYFTTFFMIIGYR